MLQNNKKSRKIIYIFTYLLLLLVLTTSALNARYTEKTYGTSTATVAKFDASYELYDTSSFSINCNDIEITLPSKKITLNNNSEVSVIADVKIALKDKTGNIISMPKSFDFNLYNSDESKIEDKTLINDSITSFKVKINPKTSLVETLKLEFSKDKAYIEKTEANIYIYQLNLVKLIEVNYE